MYSKLHKAWAKAKVHTEVKQKADAVNGVYVQRVTMMDSDWNFKGKFGKTTHDAKLLAQSFYEGFEKRSLKTACWRTRQRRNVNKRGTPETSRQLGLNLDTSLTIQTQKRHMSMEREELRVSSCWLLTQMRQPGRLLLSDLTVSTWNDPLEELSDGIILMEREVQEKAVACSSLGWLPRDRIPDQKFGKSLISSSLPRQ